MRKLMYAVIRFDSKGFAGVVGVFPTEERANHVRAVCEDAVCTLLRYEIRTTSVEFAD